jgi:hypothetical protein
VKDVAGREKRGFADEVYKATTKKKDNGMPEF